MFTDRIWATSPCDAHLVSLTCEHPHTIQARSNRVQFASLLSEEQAGGVGLLLLRLKLACHFDHGSAKTKTRKEMQRRAVLLRRPE